MTMTKAMAGAVAAGVLGLAALLLAWVTVSQASSDAETEKICAQAEERYQELLGDQPPEEGVVVVLMYKYTFCPPDLEVKAGTTMRWINVDKRTSHSVWFKEDGKPESDRLFPEEFVDMTLDEAGSFNYICGPHGDQEKMRGKVTVVP